MYVLPALFRFSYPVFPCRPSNNYYWGFQEYCYCHMTLDCPMRLQPRMRPIDFTDDPRLTICSLLRESKPWTNRAATASTDCVLTDILYSSSTFSRHPPPAVPTAGDSYSSWQPSCRWPYTWSCRRPQLPQRVPIHAIVHLHNPIFIGYMRRTLHKRKGPNLPVQYFAL